jgi:hypothetical protein
LSSITHFAHKFGRALTICTAAAAFAMLTPQVSSAALLLNPSFESGTGVYVARNTNFVGPANFGDGWSISFDPAAANFGAAGNYATALGNPPNANRVFGKDGSRVIEVTGLATVWTRPADRPLAAPGESFALAVLGHRAFGGTGITYAIDFFDNAAGFAPLASSTFVPTLPSGTDSASNPMASVAFSSTAAPEGTTRVGVRVISTNGNYASTYHDNFRLTTTAVPEPGAAFVASGAGLMLLARRRGPKVDK